MPILLVHRFRRRRKFDLGSALFWVGLAALFRLPSAYLEYPDDSWEHNRRIFCWEQASSIGEIEAR